MTTSFSVGTRVSGNDHTRSFGRTGTVTRVIFADGATGGVFEVRWDGESRPSRSAGFEAGDNLVAVEEAATLVRHPDGLIWFVR